MNSFKKNPLTRDKKLALALIVALTFAVTLLAKAISHGAVQSQGLSTRIINGKRLADKEPPAERISFTENGPTGRWSASVIPDLSRNSTTSPVVVTGTGTLMGNAQWRNLQLTHVTLKNYSSKTLLGIQLKWFITTKMDPSKILPPPGYTGLFEARLLPGDKEKFECPLIKFSQAIKYLVKNGTLEGDFLLHVRVFEAEFEDSSTWNDDWGGPKPGDQGEPWRGINKPNSLQNHAVQSSCGHTLCSYDSPDSHSFCAKSAQFLS